MEKGIEGMREQSKRLIDGTSLLEWLMDLYQGTGYREEKYAYGRVEQQIESGIFDIPSDQQSIISQQSKEIKKLRDVLKWYEDAVHYDSKPSDDPFEKWEVPDIVDDRGSRARTALLGESP